MSETKQTRMKRESREAAQRSPAWRDGFADATEYIERTGSLCFTLSTAGYGACSADYLAGAEAAKRALR